MATPPLPSRVPMVGRDQYACITPALLGYPWWGEINMPASPLRCWGTHGGEKSIWLQNPCLLGWVKKVHQVQKKNEFFQK